MSRLALPGFLKGLIPGSGEPEVPPMPTDLTSPIKAISKPAWIGLGFVLVFIAFFFLWGGTAPLSGGAVATGRISPEGNRRTIQHLEGGIISQIHVRDGDLVEMGETLVTLQETAARANYQVFLGQQRLLEAQRARLFSEQAGLDEPVFPDDILLAAENNSEIADILETQRQLFDQRAELHDNRQSVMRSRISQLEEEITGLRDQVVAQNRRTELIDQEIEDVTSLVDQGLAPRPRLYALQREQASIEEQRAGNQAAIARAQQSIGETEIQLLAIDSERLDQIAQEINAIQSDLSTVNERLIESQDVLERTDILAPITGTVVNLRYRTTGGVIRPGDPVLDIVPLEEALIIDARLSPLDVDSVSPGQPVQVNLTALPQRNLPVIYGEVIDVSADALFDDNTGETYFRLRARVDQERIDALIQQFPDDIILLPGMPVDVLVVTGERTMIEYLLSPLTESLRRAMREG